MRLALVTLFLASILVIQAAAGVPKQQLKRQIAKSKGCASCSPSNASKRSVGRARGIRIPLHDRRSANVFGHDTDGPSDADNDNNNSTLSISSVLWSSAATPTGIPLFKRTAAATPFAATTTVTETVVPSKRKDTESQDTSSHSEPSQTYSSVASETASPSSSSSATTTTQTAKVVYNKINMTLANMPYEQVMCDNNTEVQSGSVINATWLSKGKYTNTVYIRYGIDGYSAWNLPVGGTLPPLSGIKVIKKPTSDEFDDDDDDDSNNINATYRMTFQTQVFAFQKGLKLSIVVSDNEKGLPIVNYESPEIFIKSQCKRKEKEPISGNDEKGSSTKPNAEDDDGDDGGEAAKSDEVDFKPDLDKVDAKNAGARVNMNRPVSANSTSSTEADFISSEDEGESGSGIKRFSSGTVGSVCFVTFLIVFFSSMFIAI